MRNRILSAIIIASHALLLGCTSCNTPEKKEVQARKEQPKMLKTIGNPGYGNVNCILQDKAGILWFGTTENGLYRFDGESFSRFLTSDGLSNNEVYSLFEESAGRLWIGTAGGPCLFDGKTFTEVKIPLSKELPANDNSYYRNSHWVYQILQTKDGTLWFATIDGVYRYDGKEFSLFDQLQEAQGYLTPNDKAERMLEDRAGNLWFGSRTNEGVFRYDGKSISRLKLEVLYQNGPSPKPHAWGWPQVQDRNGNIWFSSWGGAYRYDGQSFTTFSEAEGLPGMVTRIVEDRKGNLWFGGDGLCRYDGKSFQCFGVRDGLNTSGVWSILEDNAGNIWVGTRETGLFLYDGNKFIRYSEHKEQSAKVK